VAGIAGAVELLSDVRPGQELDLAAELEAVDAETLGYSGTANVGETPVIRLRDCVGPMVPTADFDDPQSLRDRFALLRTDGAVPGAFCGLPVLNLQLGPVKPGRSASAILHVPEDAPLFADHFPRRAVFPGTLLMHANLQTAALLAVEIPVRAGAAWEARVVSDVKLRNFIAPGERLNLEARQTDHTETDLTIAIESRINRRLIGSAHIRFTLEGRV
jgi:3-hydroxyacyl-[acyl-carrier-protein] dehydratase